MWAVVLRTALSACAPTGASDFREQHLADLSRYCAACWRNARLPMDHWPDCTQEVFRRLLERVPAGQWNLLLKNDTEERRELVRAIDAVRKRLQRDRHRTQTGEDWASEIASPQTQQCDENRQELDSASQKLLTQRQRQIVSLTRAGWSVPEIAENLTTTCDRVSDEKYKAIQKRRKYFAGRGELNV